MCAVDVKKKLDEACGRGRGLHLTAAPCPVSIHSLLHTLEDTVANILDNEKGQPGLWIEFNHLLSSEEMMESPPFPLHFFFFPRATLEAYGGTQARGSIGATTARLHDSHSNISSKPLLGPTPQLKATPDP